jgi:hypothetical protein
LAIYGYRGVGSLMAPLAYLWLGRLSLGFGGTWLGLFYGNGGAWLFMAMNAYGGFAWVWCCLAIYGYGGFGLPMVPLGYLWLWWLCLGYGAA